MKVLYSIEEVMDMHVICVNKVMQIIDKNKRFVHNQEEKTITTFVFKKSIFSLSSGKWAKTRTQTYSEVYEEDFKI